MPNPYVGPRAFGPGERLYGRDDEVRDLYYLLAAERIVLLHSPSGAGKTSLIQAALVPRLLAADFSVLPLIRVGIEPPPDAPRANRYLLSTLISLDSALPEDAQRPLADLVALGLDAYLAGRPGAAAPTGSEVLIFDQFEEVLTSSPADQAAKAEFSALLGAALRDRRRWALFAMREEYVAALEPLLRPIPTHLSNTFRLELLGPEAAMQAIQEPARAEGVEVQPDAARLLVDDLRRATVQRPDGSAELVLGEVIEPVQLQVVCLRLWERLPAGATQIDAALVAGQPADLAADPQIQGATPRSTVDRALMEYYAERVRAVAAASGVRERPLRDWCESQLITVDGLRGQVLQQQGSSAGLVNTAIGGLTDAHLLRADKRRGAIWYELAHDRLIAPIRQDNAAWRERNLSLLQRQAALWEQQRRPEALLLSGEVLSAQEQLAAQDPEALSELDGAFLDCCRAARAAQERAAEELAAERARAARERRLLRLITALAVVVILALLVAVSLAFYANQQAERARMARDGEAAQRQTAESAASQAQTAEARAEQERAAAESAARLARANELAARAQDAPPQLALILAAAATHIRLDAGEVPPTSSIQALINALSVAGGRGLSVAGTTVSAYALSPDGSRIAVGTDSGEVRIYDPRATSLAEPLVSLSSTSSAPVSGLAFSPDGQTLAVGLFNVSAAVYRLDDLRAPPLVWSGSDPERGPIRVAFVADGRRLLLLGDQQLWLADPAALQRAEQLAGDTLTSAVTLSPDRRWLVIATQDGPIRRWDLAVEPVGPATELVGPGDVISALAFSRDGRWLIGGGLDGQIRRWENTAADPAATLTLLGAHTERVNALAFSPDGRSVASASDDTSVRLWQIDQPGAAPQVLDGHSKAVLSIAFSLDGRWLASAGDDTTVRLWDMAASPPESQDLRGHEGAAGALAFSAQGDLLVSRSDDGTLRLWPINQPGPALPQRVDIGSCIGVAGASALALGPDGRTLAVGSDAGGAILDLEASDPGAAARCLPGTDAISQLAFGGAGRWLMTSSYSPTLGSQVRVLDLGDPALGAALTVDASERFALSADGNWLALATYEATIQIYTLEKAAIGKPIWSTPPLASGITTLALAPDGRWLAAALGEGTQLWDVQAGNGPPRTLAPASAGFAPSVLAFSPDGRWLVIGETSGALRAWDLAAPDTPPRALPGESGPISALAFSADGLHITAVDQRERRIYRRALSADSAANTLDTFLEQTSNSDLLSLSPDGSRLLSGDRVWNVEARSTPLVLGELQIAAELFSADGHRAIIASRDGLLRIWELRPADLADLACSTAGRGLKPSEREMYFSDQPDQPDPCAPAP